MQLFTGKLTNQNAVKSMIMTFVVRLCSINVSSERLEICEQGIRIFNIGLRDYCVLSFSGWVCF